jgi:hypothetical protein
MKSSVHFEAEILWHRDLTANRGKRIDVEKSSYHQLSHFEIGGDNPPLLTTYSSYLQWAASEWFPFPWVLPAARAQSLDYHTASGKLSKQFHHSLRRFTVSRDDDSPFQILSKFF